MRMYLARESLSREVDIRRLIASPWDDVHHDGSESF